MNLKFVEAFVWVARLKSITRAAEKLCLTQSAVSNRIAALEEELRAELIDRRNPRFRLSDAGERFLSYAERFLALQRELHNELGTPETGPFSLRIGAIESVLHTWLIPMVDSLKRASPQINFELTVEASQTLIDQLRRGSLDLVFAALPAHDEGLTNAALQPFEMVLAGSASFAGHEQLDLAELIGHDLLTFQRGSLPHVSLINALHAFGISDKHVHTVSSISALVLLAENSFGIATLPRQVLARLAPRHAITPLTTPLQLAPLPIYASYWSTPSNAIIKQAIQEALRFIHTYGAPPPSA